MSPKRGNWNYIVLGAVPSACREEVWHDPGAVKTHIFLEMSPESHL